MQTPVTVSDHGLPDEELEAHEDVPWTSSPPLDQA